MKGKVCGDFCEFTLDKGHFITDDSVKKNKFYPLGGTTVFLVDQWAKHYVEKNLKMGEKRKLTEKLELRRVHNPGICLGVFANKPEKVKKLTEAGTGIVTVIQMLTLLGNSNILRKTGITLAAAGAWSNLTDRYHKEKVVDYIGVKTGKEKLDQVTYNLGDFAIGAGGVLWVLGSMFKKEGKEL